MLRNTRGHRRPRKTIEIRCQLDTEKYFGERDMPHEEDLHRNPIDPTPLQLDQKWRQKHCVWRPPLKIGGELAAAAVDPEARAAAAAVKK